MAMRLEDPSSRMHTFDYGAVRMIRHFLPYRNSTDEHRRAFGLIKSKRPYGEGFSLKRLPFITTIVLYMIRAHRQDHGWVPITDAMNSNLSLTIRSGPPPTFYVFVET